MTARCSTRRSGEWLEEHARGDFDHLLIGSSLPLLLAPALHYLEAWNEAVCAGAWGRLAARMGEKVRQGARPRALGGLRILAGPDHGALAGRRRRREWAAARFDRRAVGRRAPRLPGRGRRSRAAAACARPSTRRPARRSATRSTSASGKAIRFAWAPAGDADRQAARAIGGGRRTALRWRFAHDAPFFDNQVCFVEIDGRRARMWLQKTVPEENEGYSLETVFERGLA